MDPARHFRSKVCLVGDAAVGKTSLIRRFVLNHFDDHYLATIGTKVSKKTLDLPFLARDVSVRVDLSIWDIMGQPRIRDLLEDSYFSGANGILAVVDLTRRLTLENLPPWIESVQRVAGSVPVVLAANKADLGSAAQIKPAEVRVVGKTLGAEYVSTSAKTGENVDELFRRLGILLVKGQLELPPARIA